MFMRWLGVFWMIAMSLVTLTAAEAAETDGFRGFKWGSELAAMSSIELKRVEGQLGAEPGVNAFQLQNSEDLILGGVKADGIIFDFYNGKFTAASIDFKGFNSFEKLMAYCKKLYGPVTGSVTMKQEQYISFDSPKTGVMLVYQMSTTLVSNYGRLYLYSKEFLK